MREAFDELTQSDVHFDIEDENHVQIVVDAAQKPAHEIFDSKPASEKHIIFTTVNAVLELEDLDRIELEQWIASLQTITT